jgi:hypothetical protein
MDTQTVQLRSVVSTTATLPTRHMRTLLFVPLALATSLAVSAVAQQAPTVRLISAPDASTKPTLGVPVAARQLPNGRVLVNDVAKRQLVLFDQTLAVPTVVADSVSGGANSYGPRPGAIIGYAGDSTLFIDPADLSMFVLDPNGAIARVAAVPRSQDAGMMGSNVANTPAVDTKGRLVYRGGFGRIMPTTGKNGAMTMPEPPDSSAIVRVDLATRKLDTAGFFKIAKNKMIQSSVEGRFSITSEINPMQVVDDWAVLADGSIAIVRGRDYHIDWIAADGSASSTPKMAFDWQRLSDDDKAAVIDSAKTAMERVRAAGAAGTTGAPGGATVETGQRMVVSTLTMGGDGAARGASVAAGALPPMSFVSPSELPDYRPAFNVGGVKADLDGNLWIRTSSTRAGAIAGPIYDVVNRKGEVTDRLQMPSGRSIVGFGRGGVVYMMARDDKGAWIERSHR